MANRKCRNKSRRDRRRAKREADDRIMGKMLRTCDRLGLYSQTKLHIMEMMAAVNK